MTPRKRILVFVHDGRGLGHLRRLSRVAARLQEEASVLFVTGHHDAASFVPRSCEFIHLPSLDSIEPRRSRQWGRAPFLGNDSSRGRALRAELLATAFRVFEPDGFISDYLPLGIDHELAPVLTDSNHFRKYFIVRGILGRPGDQGIHVLGHLGHQALKDHYDLILATCDERIIDIAREYSWTNDLVDRLVYTGYVTSTFDVERCKRVREDRLLPADATWVVCTAGGGKDGEDLMQRCWELALQFPECYFDVITGSRSRLSILREGWHGGTRIRVQASDPLNMPYRLGAADIVICRGGYNSLMESAVGSAKIIVAPIGTDYEQVHHAARLSAFRAMDVVHDLDALDLVLEKVLADTVPQGGLGDLRTDGIEHTARLILADLIQHSSKLYALGATH